MSAKYVLFSTAIAAMVGTPLTVMMSLPLGEPAVLLPDPLLTGAPATSPYRQAVTTLQAAQDARSSAEWELGSASDCLAVREGKQERARQPCPDTSFQQSVRRVSAARVSLERATAGVRNAEVAVEAKGAGAAPPGLPVEQGAVLILFRDESTSADREAVLRRHGLVERSRLASISLYMTALADEPADRTAEGRATRLRAIVKALKEQESIVETAVQNVAMGGAIIPRSNQPKPRDWFATAPRDPLVISRFPAAWNVNDALRERNAHVAVGVLDEGFTVHEPNDLAVISKCLPQAPNVHGTKVAAIIGARFDDGAGIDGAAPFARLHGCAPYRKLVAADFKNVATDDVPLVTGQIMFYEYVKGLDILLGLDLPLINTSLAYNWGRFKIRPSTDDDVKAIVESHGIMVRKSLLLHGDTIVVSAAGNDCKQVKNPCDPATWTNPFNWAALAGGAPNVIVVEALNRAGGKLPMSSIGGTIKAVGEDVPTIEDVRERPDGTFEDELGSCTGTSCAAPLVTAAIAQMLAATPGLKPADIKRHLGIDPSRPAPELNAVAALRASAPSFNRDVADYQQDGKVDRSDFEEFRLAFEATNPNDKLFSRSDFDGDGDVDLDDFSVIIAAWTDPDVDPQTLRIRLMQ